jgi:hypothetical protein
LTQPTLLEIFSQIKDHRRAEGKLYPLPQILLFCLLAMLAGATSYRKMHEPKSGSWTTTPPISQDDFQPMAVIRPVAAAGAAEVVARARSVAALR